MKGLLVKDFCIMKLQKTFFIMIFVMALVFAWSFKNPSYMVSFLTFISSIFVLTTISYDEFDNGYTFLFTLPISRRIYVLEKYVFGLILGAGTWCVCTVIAAICAAVTGYASLNMEWLVSYLIYLGFVLLIVSVTVPTQLKFGGDRGRLGLILTLGGIFLIGYGCVWGLKKLGINVEEVLDSAAAGGIAAFFGICFLVLFLVLGISCLISVRIMENKEL